MWIAFFVSLIVSIAFQIYKTGFNFATMLIVLPTLIAFVKLLYEHSRKFRVAYRSVKNLLNLSTFDIEFSSHFNLDYKNSKFNRLRSDHELIRNQLYKNLLQEGFEGSKNDLIRVSYDQVTGVNMFVKPHKLYMEFDQYDNSGEEILHINVSGRLKYKNGEKILENFLIKFYSQLNQHYNFQEKKYTLKIVKNTKKVDFMKKHFVKEIPSKDIKNFQINIKHANVNLTATDKILTLVTKERAHLIHAIKYTIKLIN